MGGIEIYSMAGDKIGVADKVVLTRAEDVGSGMREGTLRFAWGLVPEEGVDIAPYVKYPPMRLTHGSVCEVG
jgi:hypothetical protein